MAGRRLTLVLVGAVLAVAIVAAGLAFAPYVYAELSAKLEHRVIVGPAGVPLSAGKMVDEYWAVQEIDPQTFAIGEPRYYQSNYSYLLVGSRRALLFDAGSGTRNIAPIVAGITQLPVTVLPSHLHYDHTGGITPFASVAMLDLPRTRAAMRDGRLTPGRYDFLGMFDGLTPPSFPVTEWIKDGARIDLGNRVLEVLHTPGHTHESVALFDATAHQLFAGDYVYPTTLYAFLPGASLAEYQMTTRRLLARLPAETMIWTAHCCRVGEAAAAPWLAVADLRALDAALTGVRDGRAQGTGVYPREFPVNGQMTLQVGFPWNNR